MAKKSKQVEVVEQVDGQEVMNPDIETPIKTSKTTKAPKAPKVAKEAKVAAPKMNKTIFYLLGREVTTDDKMPLQCATIYQHIANHCGNNGMCERKALIAGITIEELKTRQGVDRIVSYYTPTLLKSGLIIREVQDVPVNIDVPLAD